MAVKIRVVYHDTAIGESTTFYTIIPELTAECVALAIYNNAEMDDEVLISASTYKVQGWHLTPDGTTAGFILSSEEPYFGNILLTGVVYTRFI